VQSKKERMNAMHPIVGEESSGRGSPRITKDAKSPSPDCFRRQTSGAENRRRLRSESILNQRITGNSIAETPSTVSHAGKEKYGAE